MTETAIPETRAERLLQGLHDALLAVRSQVRALDGEVEAVLRRVRFGRAIEARRRIRAERARREPHPAPAGTGPRLAERRVLLGLSQRDLAYLAGYSRGLIADVERGRRASPYALVHIEHALGRLERSQAEWLAREGGAPCA